MINSSSSSSNSGTARRGLQPKKVLAPRTASSTDSASLRPRTVDIYQGTDDLEGGDEELLDSIQPPAHSPHYNSVPDDTGGTIIDFDVIEQDKENIQAIPQGRSASALHSILSLRDNERSKKLRDGRAYHERRIASIDLENDHDPLDAYHQYACWLIEHYPQSLATQESGLVKLLEKATEMFKAFRRYRNDARYVSMWIKYAELERSTAAGADTQEDVFEYMRNNEIGLDLALYYEEYARVLELHGKHQKADLVLKQGIAHGADPVVRLKRRYEEFQQRVAATAARDARLAEEEQKLKAREANIANQMLTPTANSVVGGGGGESGGLATAATAAMRRGRDTHISIGNDAPNRTILGMKKSSQDSTSVHANVRGGSALGFGNQAAKSKSTLPVFSDEQQSNNGKSSVRIGLGLGNKSTATATATAAAQSDSEIEGGTAAADDGGHWDEFGTRITRRKENMREQSSWKGLMMPQKDRIVGSAASVVAARFRPGQSSDTESSGSNNGGFAVFCDEADAPEAAASKTPAPGSRSAGRGLAVRPKAATVTTEHAASDSELASPPASSELPHATPFSRKPKGSATQPQQQSQQSQQPQSRSSQSVASSRTAQGDSIAVDLASLYPNGIDSGEELSIEEVRARLSRYQLLPLPPPPQSSARSNEYSARYNDESSDDSDGMDDDDDDLDYDSGLMRSKSSKSSRSGKTRKSEHTMQVFPLEMTTTINVGSMGLIAQKQHQQQSQQQQKQSSTTPGATVAAPKRRKSGRQTIGSPTINTKLARQETLAMWGGRLDIDDDDDDDDDFDDDDDDFYTRQDSHGSAVAAAAAAAASGVRDDDMYTTNLAPQQSAPVKPKSSGKLMIHCDDGDASVPEQRQPSTSTMPQQHHQQARLGQSRTGQLPSSRGSMLPPPAASNSTSSSSVSTALGGASRPLGGFGSNGGANSSSLSLGGRGLGLGQRPLGQQPATESVRSTIGLGSGSSGSTSTSSSGLGLGLGRQPSARSIGSDTGGGSNSLQLSGSRSALLGSSGGLASRSLSGSTAIGGGGGGSSLSTLGSRRLGSSGSSGSSGGGGLGVFRDDGSGPSVVYTGLQDIPIPTNLLPFPIRQVAAANSDIESTASVCKKCQSRAFFIQRLLCAKVDTVLEPNSCELHIYALDTNHKNHYTVNVHKIIGRGGFGTVIQGNLISTSDIDDIVVAKIEQPSTTTEARIIQHLLAFSPGNPPPHSTIVQPIACINVHASCLADTTSTSFLVMPYYSHTCDLLQLMNVWTLIFPHNPFDIRLAMYIAGNVALVLTRFVLSCSTGAVHRDIKPENILARFAPSTTTPTDNGYLSSTGMPHVTLIDFGQSQFCDYRTTEATAKSNMAVLDDVLGALDVLVFLITSGKVRPQTQTILSSDTANTHTTSTTSATPTLAEQLLLDRLATKQRVATRLLKRYWPVEMLANFINACCDSRWITGRENRGDLVVQLIDNVAASAQSMIDWAASEDVMQRRALDGQLKLNLPAILNHIVVQIQ